MLEFRRQTDTCLDLGINGKTMQWSVWGTSSDQRNRNFGYQLGNLSTKQGFWRILPTKYGKSAMNVGFRHGGLTENQLWLLHADTSVYSLWVCPKKWNPLLPEANPCLFGLPMHPPVVPLNWVFGMQFFFSYSMMCSLGRFFSVGAGKIVLLLCMQASNPEEWCSPYVSAAHNWIMWLVQCLHPRFFLVRVLGGRPIWLW